MSKQKKATLGSGAEDRFIELFCEVFGPERGGLAYLQYPFVDIYGKHRTIDFAINTADGKIAFEIDGETWHNPSKVAESKYLDDLLKQNSMIYNGWKIYRWTDSQLVREPERIKDELVTFLGTMPELLALDEGLPRQSGAAFTLREHQEDALLELARMRAEGKTIALVQGATGTGKTAIGVLDAKSVGGRVLFLAHTRELVEQGRDNFSRLWPEATLGLYLGASHEIGRAVTCASIQGVARNIELFRPDEFDYIMIDECHHAATSTYKKILSYFRPHFTLGLTATPEREDGQDLLEIFQNMTRRLDVEAAVERGLLSPVRCIRIKTNVDLTDVRINGFKYNNLDLETAIKVPERNKLIVDTYQKFASGKQTVVFCTSVKHSDMVAELFRERGVAAKSISGQASDAGRKNILAAYERRELNVLCACDLLNEGWDSPKTEVLFMARPTMSKTIYLQQLGRGMRRAPGKEYLLVFDFVDNAGIFNTPYSMHRMFNASEYYAGGLVLGKKQEIAWEKEMFARGERPEALIDFPVQALDYQVIDIFNWQNEAKNMLSQLELTRRLDVQTETIIDYIGKGKIKADLEVPTSDKKRFRYFREERVKEFCQKFGWQEINASTIKPLFMKMVGDSLTRSYKPVFIKAFFSSMDEKGKVNLSELVQEFASFYEARREKGLKIEKAKSIFDSDGYTDKQVEQLILRQPFARFEQRGFMHHTKYFGTIELDRRIVRCLTAADRAEIIRTAAEAIARYYGDN